MRPTYQRGAGQINDNAQGAEMDAHTPTVMDACKSFLTLQARAAIAGYALRTVADGYLLCRWDRARQLPDLLAVAAVLVQMGVRA